MTNILVTGAGGQLGTELKREAAGSAAHCNWIWADVEQMDMTDIREITPFLERVNPCFVVNCAAYTDVDRAEKEPEAAFRVNRDAVAVLASEAARRDIPLIHISTDFVFGGSEHPPRLAGACCIDPAGVSDCVPYTENDEPHPLNVYGQSKLEGERAVLASGCRGAVLRTSWLYSPYGRNFVKSIMSGGSRNPEIRVVCDQWGTPTAADGLARAILGMIPLMAESEGRAAVYHFSDTGVVNRSDFAREIIRLSGLDCRVIPVSSVDYPQAARRPEWSALDSSKIGRHLGIGTRPWRDALAACIARIGDNY